VIGDFYIDLLKSEIEFQSFSSKGKCVSGSWLVVTNCPLSGMEDGETQCRPEFEKDYEF